MKKIAFYLMNKKGFCVLKQFIKTFDSKNINYVVCSRDNNVKKDYYQEIQNLCIKYDILFFDRNTDYIKKEKYFKGYKFTIGWRWIIKHEKKLIICHDSLLPNYRGFAPLVNSLISNEKSFGVTALFANSEYDKGNIIMQKAIQTKYPITINKIINKIIPLYSELIKEIYKFILKDKALVSKKQNENNATYSMWLDEKDYFIDWNNWNAKKIKRFVDSVGYPFDNAKVYLDENIIKFVKVKVLDDVTIKQRSRHIGKVIMIKDSYPVVICKKGLLSLLNIKTDKDDIPKISLRSRFS